MAVVEKTFHAPYVRVYNNLNTTAVSKVTGIFDSIQVTSDLATDDATFDITPVGGAAVTAKKVSSGDTIHGPFKAFAISTATDDDVSVIVHERSNITTN